MIAASNIRLKNQDRNILNSVSFQLEEGECVGIIGANGAGKTTLLRAILGFVKAEGECHLWQLNAKARARQISWLSQERRLVWDMTAEEVIALGRIPWQGFAQSLSTQDQEHIENAIAEMNLQNFRKRALQSMSGGEQARVFLARLIAQNTPYIFADEPIANLDPAAQLQVLASLRKMAMSGKGVLVTLHDLSLAARFFDRLILMKDGAILAEGESEDVLHAENLRQAFGIDIHQGKIGDTPYIVPLEIKERENG